MLRSLLAAVLVGLSVLAEPASAQTFTQAEFGLQSGGDCPQFAVRERAGRTMVPIGCVAAGTVGPSLKLMPGTVSMQGPLPAVDMSLSKIENPNAIMLGAGNTIAFCPALSCVTIPDAGHQRASFLVSAHTQDDGHSEEQTLAVMTTVDKGFHKKYAASTSYAVGDNVIVGNASYRALTSGVTSPSSPPPGTTPSTSNFTFQDGGVRWLWINETAIAGAKVGIYNELKAIPGAGGVWGQANNVQLMPGVKPTFMANIELDTANHSGTECALGQANCYGLWLNQGGSARSTAGLYISSFNCASGVNCDSSWATFWAQRFAGERLASESNIEMDTTNGRRGLSFGGFTGASFTDQAILDKSTSPVSLQISGSKSVSSIVDDANSPTALNIAGNKSFAAIYEHSSTPAGISLDGIYSRAQIEGRNWSVDPVGFGKFSGINIGSGAPPSSTAPCNTGDIRTGSDWFYVCVATNTWKRSALSSW